MYKILKAGGGLRSDHVVMIPDMEPIVNPKSAENEEETQEKEPELTPWQLAEIEAGNMLEETQRQCEEMLAQAQGEADNIRLQAWQQGYDEAFQSQVDAITDCLRQTKGTITVMQQAQDAYMEEYAQKLAPFAMDIAGNIMKRKMDADPLALCDLVEDVMSSVKEANWVVIKLSKQLVPLIELLESELPAKCPTIANLEVQGKDMPVGTCIIDSSVGVIDASIQSQLENLTKRFEQIQQKRGKP